MDHDRIHAQQPAHHPDRWSVGTIDAIDDRDGHCLISVTSASRQSVDLVVTPAIRDLVCRRLATDADASPVGEQVWFRRRGGD